jgi:hypothetical protein
LPSTSTRTPSTIQPAAVCSGRVTYEEAFGWHDEDEEDPETAEEADWAITAKAA